MNRIIFNKDGIAAEELYFTDKRLVRVFNNSDKAVYIKVNDYTGKIEPGMTELYPRISDGKLMDFEHMQIIPDYKYGYF